MEQVPNRQEKVASMNINDYLEAIADFDLLDGKIPEDTAHAFYLWVSREPAFQNIDGASLSKLYEKNVLETGMEHDRFFRWCKDFGFPYPLESNGAATPEGKSFNINFLAKEDEKRVALYETWAEEHGIDYKEDAVMRFFDAQGNMYRVRTDSDNRGEIIVD